MLDGATQVRWFRARIIIEKIDQVATRLFDGGIPLDRGLTSARDENFDSLPGVIERARSGHSQYVRLPGARWNDDSDERQIAVHAAKVVDCARSRQLWGKG